MARAGNGYATNQIMSQNYAQTGFSNNYMTPTVNTNYYGPQPLNTGFSQPQPTSYYNPIRYS